MQNSATSGRVRRRFAAVGTLWIGLLCVGVGGSYALAQNTVPPKPKAKAAPKQKAQEQVPPKGQPKVVPKSKTAPKGGGVRQINRGRRQDPGFVMNPNAKWACDQQTMTLEPVWRGSQALTWNFDIRNEGTSNLQIKARGG